MFVIFLLLASFSHLSEAACNCTNPDWCKPINVPPRDEVFVFSALDTDKWKEYNWTKVTTLGTFEQIDQELICLAHSHNARIVFATGPSSDDIANQTAAEAWIKTQIDYVMSLGIDGINIDTESPIGTGEQFINFSRLLVEAFHTAIPGSQVSFDITYLPTINDTFFHYTELGQLADILFIMEYDMSDGKPIAGPNCDLSLMVTGIKHLLTMDVDPYKLVSGLPWYGYDFTCVKNVSNTTSERCHVADQRWLPYFDIETLMVNSTTGVMWDYRSSSPYFDYVDSSNNVHQMWYDNLQSLAVRIEVVEALGLRGVGVWTPDDINYNGEQGAWWALL